MHSVFHMQDLCSVCMETTEGRNDIEGAPCGWSGPWFHSSCLKKIQDSQGPQWRCPHCNQTVYSDFYVLDGVKKDIMNWLSSSAPTFRSYLFVQKGLQSLSKEGRILRCLMSVILDLLHTQIFPCGGVRVSRHKWKRRRFSCLGRGGQKIVIELTREAYLKCSFGSIEKDGYDISASKKTVKHH